VTQRGLWIRFTGYPLPNQRVGRISGLFLTAHMLWLALNDATRTPDT